MRLCRCPNKAGCLSKQAFSLTYLQKKMNEACNACLSVLTELLVTTGQSCIPMSIKSGHILCLQKRNLYGLVQPLFLYVLHFYMVLNNVSVKLYFESKRWL